MEYKRVYYPLITRKGIKGMMKTHLYRNMNNNINNMPVNDNNGFISVYMMRSGYMLNS